MGLQKTEPYEITRKGEVDSGMLRSILFIETNGTGVHTVEAGFCFTCPKQKLIGGKQASGGADL